MEKDELKSRTAKGLLWGGIGNGAMQLLNLVFGIFLARLLSPDDYGVVGALTIFSAIARLLCESGFTLAIVNRRNVTHADYNAVFWFNLIMSVGLYAILFFLAPLIAAFYRQPEMTALSRFLFLGFVFGGLSTTPAAYILRNLMVKQQSQLQIVSLIISGVAGVTCAFNGWGFWGIALQTVTYSGCSCLLMWFVADFRPTLSFNKESLMSMLPFSTRQLITSLFTHVNNNLFSVILGRFYGMITTGFYTQGNKWTMMGYSTLVGMINSVGQPVLRQTIDERERTLRVFRKLLRFTAFVSFPALFGLAIVAEQLIVITISDKWMESVGVMQVLCVGAAFLPLGILFGNLFNSIGRPSIYMWNTIAAGLCQMAAICLSYRLGLRGMLMIYVTINISWIFVWQYFARRHIGYTIRQMLSDIVPYLIVTLIVTGGAQIAAQSITSPVISLIVKIFIAAAAYCLILSRLKSGEFRESIEFLLKKRRPQA